MPKIEITSDFFKSKPQKPLEAVTRLIHSFSVASEPLLGRYGDDQIKLIDDKKRFNVILILKGKVDVWRNHDDLLVGTVTAPGILGLQGSEFRYHTHTFRCHKDSDIHCLTRDMAMDIIMENKLLEDVLTYQAYISDHQSYRDILMVNNSTYDIVCMLLTELSQDQNHAEISVEKYILSRTRLARSGVRKIIADLRFGGFIIMDNGKLLKLGLPFPKKY